MPAPLGTFARSGLGDPISDQLVLLQRRMHDLALSIQLADASGQTAAAAAFRQQFAQLQSQANALISQQRSADSPSGFMWNLSNLGDTLAGILKSAGTVVLIVGGAYLFFSSRRGRR